MAYEASPCEAGADRVCVSCARSSECVEQTEQCANVAHWWRQANCCEDDDGVQVPCNEQTESDVRVGKRHSRQHWVFDVLPEVEEGYEQGDATTLQG